MAQPMGQPSWLDFYIAKQREEEAANPDAVSFQLNDEDCMRLWREGVQYYHRYLSFWHLGRYDLCARDTVRNLRLFEFVRDLLRSGTQQTSVRPMAAVCRDDACPRGGDPHDRSGPFQRGVADD